MVPCMADTEGPRDNDLIAELADRGEATLRRIVGFPRRVLADAKERVGERFGDVATKLRSIDPLDRRVAELEQRLDSFETPEKAPATRATPPPTRVASKVVGQARSRKADDDPGHLGRILRPSSFSLLRSSLPASASRPPSGSLSRHP